MRKRGREGSHIICTHWTNSCATCCPGGEMVESNEDGIVISTIGRLAGIPKAASLYPSSNCSISVSKWMVPKCCGPALPLGSFGMHLKFGSLSIAPLNVGVTCMWQSRGGTWIGKRMFQTDRDRQATHTRNTRRGKEEKTERVRE